MASKAKGIIALAGLAVVAGVGIWLALAARQPSGDEGTVRRLIDHYFASWSEQSMDEYRDCFHQAALIAFVDSGGRLYSYALGPFIESQKEAHQKSPVRMKEVPVSVDLRMAGRIAQAAVRWELSKGTERITGTDLFTLQKSGAGWKIISLVFAND